MTKSVKTRIWLLFAVVGLLALLQAPLHVAGWLTDGPTAANPPDDSNIKPLVEEIYQSLQQVKTELDAAQNIAAQEDNTAPNAESFNNLITVLQTTLPKLEKTANPEQEAQSSVASLLDSLSLYGTQLIETGPTGEETPRAYTYLEEVDGLYINSINTIRNRQSNGTTAGVNLGILFMVLGVLVSLLTVALSVVFAFILSNNLYRPLARLKEFVEELSEGKRDTAPEIDRNDELGALADELDDLRSKMASWEKAVRKELQRHEALANEMTRVANQVLDGILSDRIDFEGINGVYAEMANTWNSALGMVQLPLQVSIDFLDSLAQGQYPTPIEDEFPGEFDSLKEVALRLDHVFREYFQYTTAVVEAAGRGELRNTDELPEFHGVYGETAETIVKVFNDHSQKIELITGQLEKLGSGVMPRELAEECPGEWASLKQAMQQCIFIIDAMVGETIVLVHQVVDGNLEIRADTERFQGDYRNILDGLNRILDSFSTPHRELSEVLESMSKGNLTTMMTGDYKGDHALIANTMNRTLKFSRRILNQIGAASGQISSTATQLAGTSQLLSQGATNQASSLQEVSVTLAEVSQQTKKNSDNAVQARSLVEETSQNADRGNEHMRKMMQSMSEISKAARSISKIIRVIDEIAFQTNLLALNAAVEAAHAGKHGKGFAVVADEVRNLAQRSADAAKETAAMIENTIRSVQSGTLVATQTAEVLNQIVDKVTSVNERIADITLASQGQAASIDQVKETLYSIEGVTQGNVESAQIAAASSEELSGQALELENTFRIFRLDKTEVKSPKSGEVKKVEKPIKKPVTEDYYPVINDFADDSSLPKQPDIPPDLDMGTF